MKAHFGQEKRSQYERCRLIPKFDIEYDENEINELNQCLTEKWYHVKSLYDLLIIVLTALTRRIAYHVYHVKNYD